MNLTRFILCISLVISSGWALPTTQPPSDPAKRQATSANPDDDAETVDVIPNVPAVPETPEVPKTPDTIGGPGIVLIPLHPGYDIYNGLGNEYGGIGGGGYGGYGSYNPFSSYFPINPFNWNFNYITDIFSQLRNTAASTWSRTPALTPSVPALNVHPPAESDSNTTSEVKIINGRKVTINETVYTTKTAFGHSIYKVRTVDVQPLDDNEGDSTTVPPPSPSDNGITESNIEPLEPHNKDDDSNVDIDELTRLEAGSPEELDESRTNDIVREIEDVEVIDDEINEPNNKLEKFEPLSWSSNEKYSIGSGEQKHNNDEALENFDIDEQYAHGTEQVPIDLSNDIAINQMLADQGAAENPDAEVFDIHEYNFDRQQSPRGAAMQAHSAEEQNEAIEYMPFYHTNANKRQQIVVDEK